MKAARMAEMAIIKKASFFTCYTEAVGYYMGMNTKSIEIQEIEESEFVLATEGEWNATEARFLGAMNPNQEFVLTDRDTWHRNPFYTGKQTAFDPEGE